MNIFIIIFGCLLISVIIYFVFSTKKSSNKQGNCQPDLKSCSGWKKVSTAYIPCIEGQSQKCGPNGQGCEETEICTLSGCCVQCQSPEDLPNSATQTCGPDSSGCIVQPDGESGFTTYVCTCTDKVTVPPTGTCTNFQASYIQKETGNLVPITNLTQNKINQICGEGQLILPQNWTNTLSDSGNQTTLSRKCDTDPVKNTGNRYVNFTCPSGLQPDVNNYKCTTSPANICTPPTRNQCEVTVPDYPCNPEETPSVNYCPDGTLDCIQKYGNNDLKGYNQCLENPDGTWSKSSLCSPCCDIEKGYQANTSSTGPLCVQTCIPPLKPHMYNGISYCVYYDPITWNVSNDMYLTPGCTTSSQSSGSTTEQCICSKYGPEGLCSQTPFNRPSNCPIWHTIPNDPGNKWFRTYFDNNHDSSWCTELGNVPNNTWYCSGNGSYTYGQWEKCTNPAGCTLNQGWLSSALVRNSGADYDHPVRGCTLADLDQILAQQQK